VAYPHTYFPASFFPGRYFPPLEDAEEGVSELPVVTMQHGTGARMWEWSDFILQDEPRPADEGVAIALALLLAA
jgi:hypothetical protein